MKDIIKSLAFVFAQCILPSGLKKKLREVKALQRIRPVDDLLDLSYEPNLRAMLTKIVRPGWVAVDVGANVGLITFTLAKLVGPNGQVFAFEAHPTIADRLRRNMCAYSVDERVHIENKAVSDGTRDFLSLYPGRGRSDSEWNIVGSDVQGNKTLPEMEIPAVALDNYFPQDKNIDIIKIDVEGAGCQVLEGMRRILTKKPIIVFEFHDETEWQGRQELLDLGYSLYSMDGLKLDPGVDLQRVYHCLIWPPGMGNYSGTEQS